MASATITNSGKIFLVDDFTRKGDLDLFRNDGIFASAGSISLIGRDATSRTLLAPGSILIAGLRPDDKTQVLTAGKAIAINAATIGITAQQTGKTVNRAKIRAGGDIALTTPGVLTIGGSVEMAAGRVVLSGVDIVTTRSAAIYAGGAGFLNSAGGLSNAGSLVVTNQLELSKNFGRFSNSGVVSMGRTGAFSLTGAFTNTGYIGGDGPVAMTAASFANDGHLQSGPWMNLTSSGDMRLKGATVAKGNMALTAGNLVLDKGLMTLNAATGKPAPNVGFISAGNLQIKAAQFISRGNISLTGAGPNEWKIAEDFRQEGLTESSGPLTLTGREVVTAKGSLISSSGDLVLQGASGKAAKNFDLSGSLIGQHVTLRNGAEILLRSPSVVSSSGNIALEADKGITLAGQASAKNRLDITGAGLRVSGTNYANILNARSSSRIEHSGQSNARQTLRLTATERLVNSGAITSADSVILTGGSLLRNAVGGQIKATDLTLRLTAENVNAALDNSGMLLGAKNLAVRTGKLNNTAEGTIRAGKVDLTAQRDVSNLGVIHAFGVFARIGGGLSNAKLIRGDEIVTIFTERGGINTTSDSRIFAKIITLSSGVGLINNGHIGVAGNKNIPDTTSLRIKAVGGLTNNNAIRGNDIELVGASVTNSQAGSATASKILRIESETFGVVNNGALQGNEAAIIAKRSFENYGRITGSKKLGVVATTGRLYNKGNLYGREIELLAEKSTLLSETAIGAGSRFAAKAATAEFKAAISAGNTLGLETTAGDLTLVGAAVAKTVAIKSAGMLKARGGAVRGADVTQIIAADIQRTDITATNRKLGVVPGNVGNLYIELKSGSFGTAPAEPLKNAPGTALSQYEQANLTASGSVEVIASKNLFLTGVIKSQKNTSLQAKEFVALKSANLTAGTKLHVQGNKYIKNYGDTVLSANTIALNQRYG